MFNRLDQLNTFDPYARQTHPLLVPPHHTCCPPSLFNNLSSNILKPYRTSSEEGLMNVDHRNHHGDPPTLPPPSPATGGGTSRKIGLSCAECRRSKLKCDRIFPCQSCVRRGCAGICPDGTLAATKGNKVLMAHAQRLQEQVKTLTARIHELENQLGQPGVKNESLQPSLIPTDGMRGTQPENEENVADSIGSLSIGLDGQAKYHGETAGSEYFQDLLPRTSHTHDEFSTSSSNSRHPPDLPPDIIDLLHAFPFGIRDRHYSRGAFQHYIPGRDRAAYLSNLYFIHIGWMYEPISRADFTASILDVIYVNGERRLDSIHSHKLSVFFIILANGAVFDDDHNVGSISRTYHALSRAAFSLDSIYEEATCATVQAMFLIVRFLYNADRDRNEERWLLTGLNCRLAHMIGLQRDSANWNLPSDEIQRRRQIFWELFTWDAWTGVVNGRPAALAVQHTDCQFPDDLEAAILPGKERDLGWHAWKLRYAANVITASSFHVFNPRTPPYEALLDLDKKIRAFPLPAHLRSPVRNSDTGRSWSSDPAKAMQQYCAVCTRESNLLYIHRSYFAQALRQLPENPLHHKFAASVMAAYRAATRLIASLRSLYQIHAHPTGHVWYFWSGIFSSCILLGALVVESPKCTLAGDAFRELQQAVPFFIEGSRVCRSQGSVPILEKLLQRAQASFQSGIESQHPEADVDELHVLGGRKSVIKPPSNAGSPALTPGTPSSAPHEGGDDSPHSHAGAEEMLAEYLGHAPNTFVNRYNYDNQSVPHSAYPSEDTYAAKSPGSQTGFLRPYVSPPGSVAGPDPGLQHYHRPQQMAPSSSVASDHHQWQASYPSSVPHAQSHPQHQQTPHTGTSSLMYGHPMDVNSPQAYHPVIQRYGSGAPHERTQEEIWRDFMMGYQPS